jgi:ATP-binding cassette, subfamily B, multidrug efflux pump
MRRTTASLPEAPQDEARGKARDPRLLLRLWVYVRKHRLLLAVSVLALPVSAVLSLVQPYLLKVIIDSAIVPRRIDLLPPLAGALVLIILLDRLCQFAGSLFMEICGQRAMHDLRTAVHAHLLSLRCAYFDRNTVGSLVSRVTSDVETIAEAFVLGFVSLAGDLLLLLGILAVMLWLSVTLALVTLAVVPLLVFVVEFFRRRLRATHRHIRRRVAEINTSLEEQITGMSVVQVFNRQTRAMRRFDRTNTDYRAAYRDAIRYDSSLFALVEMLGSVAVALLLWYGGLRILEGKLTIGLLVAFIEYVHRLFVPIRDLSAKLATLQQALASSERVFELLDTTEPDAPPSSPAAEPAAPDREPATAPIPLVEYREVSFEYGRGIPVLDRVSFKVARGESLAVVGSTGSGKSTLVRLLTRLYLQGSGRILLDGLDVGAIEPAVLRRRVVVVNQDVFLLAGSLLDNITLGDEAVTRERAERAAERVGLIELLGLDHAVVERGANLSAGEQQLVAFARALARDPELLVLDEATASIDPRTERFVQQGIEELLRERTSIVIAHRLLTIEKASRILVLHHGRVVEEGTHATLVAAGGLYSRLHELQKIAAPR